MDDANVVLQAIRKSDDIPIPRVRRPGDGHSGIMEVYQGPFPGSVRDPSCPFQLAGRNQIVQHRNPARPHRNTRDSENLIPSTSQARMPTSQTRQRRWLFGIPCQKRFKHRCEKPKPCRFKKHYYALDHF